MVDTAGHVELTSASQAGSQAEPDHPVDRLTVLGAAVGFVLSQGMANVVVWAFVGFATGSLSWARAAFQHDQWLSEQAAQAAEAEQARAEAERQERIAGVLNGMAADATKAVDWFALMPKYIESAREWRKTAAARYADGAYSPFWEAVEKAYGEIGLYRRAAAAIEQCAQSHAQHLDALAVLMEPVRSTSASSATETSRDQGGKAGQGDMVPPFPVRLDVGRVRSTVDEATADLDSLVYEAQRNPTFAKIWEMRRTTAAVIEGFTNLEGAVQGMRAAVTTSLDSMSRTLHEGNTKTRDAITSAVLDSSNQSLTVLQGLKGRADQIRDELYHQNWGRYPLLG